MLIGVNSFALRQTAESDHTHFDGPWEEVVALTREHFPEARPGYRDGVVLVPVPPVGFHTGVVVLREGDMLMGRYRARREGEEPRKMVRAVPRGVHLASPHLEQDLRHLVQDLRTHATSVERIAAGRQMSMNLSSELVFLAAAVVEAATRFADLLQRVANAMRDDFVSLQDELAARPQVLSSDVLGAPRRFRSSRHPVSLYVTNAVAGCLEGLRLLEEIERGMLSRVLRPGFPQKTPCVSVDVVLYRRDVLAENAENSTQCDWEIVSVNGHITMEPAPIDPDTLIANHFRLDGGTATNMTAEHFEKALRTSVLYWKDKAVLAAC